MLPLTSSKWGYKVPKFVVFWTISTIKDEKSAAKFHYIKTVSGNVVVQSIAFRVVSIYWQGGDHFPLKCWLQVTYTLLNAASFDTFWLVAPQPQKIEKKVQLHLTRTPHELSKEHQPRFYAAPNFLKMGIKYVNLSSFGQFRQ